MPALDDSVITRDEVEREDTAAVGAGLDVLEEPDRVREPWWRKLGGSVVPPILALVVVLVVWEVVYLLGVKPEVMLPSPAAVFDELLRLLQGGQAWETIWTSLSRGLIGFAMAIVVAVPIGLAIARFNWLRTSVGPLLEMIRAAACGASCPTGAMYEPWMVSSPLWNVTSVSETAASGVLR